MILEPAPNGFFCPDDPGEPGLGEKRWSINDIEARIVGELCHGKDVLEIGTGLGISTKAIAAQAKFVYTVDIDLWVMENVAPDLPENVLFFNDINDVHRKVDVAFIDGLHSYEQCTQDIKDARRILKPGGLFIFHDAMMQSILKAIAHLHPVLIQTWAGMAMAWNDKE